jgi:probable rRNA maturation factor
MEQEPTIQFFAEDIDFRMDREDAVKDWILSIISGQQRQAYCLTYIFCSDAYLLALNREYLDHDYLTDILTFPYPAPEPDQLFSDIYISLERVRENAQTFQVSFEDELHRVMIHGVLHLLGFNDHSEEEQAQMRQFESQALMLRE